MDGHCETALFKICCLVLVDTALLVKGLTICSNLSSNLFNEGGSNLAPPLHPQPWGAGAVSLNPPEIIGVGVHKGYEHSIGLAGSNCGVIDHDPQW